MNLNFNREDLIRAIQEIDKNPNLISGRHSSTYDFQREILSYGKRVQVLAPESFIQELKAEVEIMLKNFSV